MHRLQTFLTRRGSRCSLRTFILSAGALYFLAMYIFHVDLERKSQQQRHLPDEPFLVVGADNYFHDPRRRDLPGELADKKSQRTYDDLRKEAIANALAAQNEGAEIIGHKTTEKETFFESFHVENYTDALGMNPIANSDNLLPPGLGTRTFQSDANVPLKCRAMKAHVEARPDRFKQVVGEVFLYTAYWDERPNDFDNVDNGTYIRIMAVVLGKMTRDLWCIFTSPTRVVKNGVKMPAFVIRVPVKYYELSENHNRPYGGYILSCAVPVTITSTPCVIHVTNGSNGTVPVPLRVKTLKPAQDDDTGSEGRFKFRAKGKDKNDKKNNNPTGTGKNYAAVRQYNFTVCVSPLFSVISLSRLVEFIAVSSVLGADHFVFYLYDVSAEVKNLLERYANNSERAGGPAVTILPWMLESQLDGGVWYHGQLVAIHDCLYRSTAISNHVVFSDIDEYIVPHQGESWSEMVRTLDSKLRCGFQFQSGFFNPHAVENRFVADVGMSLDTLTVTKRNAALNRMRTKCIVKPYLIFEAGIHHVSKPILASLNVLPVYPEIGYVHHYRPCTSNMGASCVGYAGDDAMLRYKQRVVNALLATKNEVLQI